MKHADFLILDQIVLQLAYILAVLIRRGEFAYFTTDYTSLGLVLFMAEMLATVLNNPMHNVLSRGPFTEAIETFKLCLFVTAIATVYMFATQTGFSYSRFVLLLTFLLHMPLGFFIRLTWKRYLIKHPRKKRSMLVVAAPDTAEQILARLSSNPAVDYIIAGVVLTKRTDLDQVGGYPVVATMDEAADYICREWVDSVYIDAPINDRRVAKLMDECSIMAVPVHYHVPHLSRHGVKRFYEKVGHTNVLTFSINYATPLRLVIKRAFDILGGLIGSLMALIIMAIFGPMIKIASPGPILFKQERIGRNGKHIKIYKLRSMYMDAEQRKQELLEDNRVKDGMMFKLDFDPRIIGNKTLPDGTQKTGLGEFLRRTSLDEFPQFFNVLSGSMSMVGTRPPTLDEWGKYSYHHRARLAITPGLTGMRQINGRSDITDFEEVVRLDTEYITSWSLLMDAKILLKTAAVIFTKKGAM